MPIFKTANNNAFRVPDKINRFRVNCSREWGCWVSGDTKKMSCMQATKAGLTYGDSQELAVCSISPKVLTFDPHYINEHFLEIWGFPVAGGIKEKSKPNCSTLVTFLLHRQSKDSVFDLMEKFQNQAFDEWADSDMKVDPDEFVRETVIYYLSSTILTFTMNQAESEYGPYFFVKCSSRKAANQFENDALSVTQSVIALQCCTDPMIESNHQACVNSLPPA